MLNEIVQKGASCRKYNCVCVERACNLMYRTLETSYAVRRTAMNPSDPSGEKTGTFRNRCSGQEMYSEADHV